jgi:hypothetical protein
MLEPFGEPQYFTVRQKKRWIFYRRSLHPFVDPALRCAQIPAPGPQTYVNDRSSCVSSRKIIPLYGAPKALSPDAMKIAFTAFERAAQDLHNDRPLTEADRAALARVVIELAEHGLRCPSLLRDAAIARFEQAA